MSIHDRAINEIINTTAEKLKEIIKVPEWALYAKTSPARQRPPYEKDWYFKRAASVLRKIYIYGPIGVNKLSVKYGGRQRRGHPTERYKRGSRKIIRTVLQQLDKNGFTIQVQKGLHKGRILTPKGKSFMDKIK